MKIRLLRHLLVLMFMSVSACTFNANLSAVADIDSTGTTISNPSAPVVPSPDSNIVMQKIYVDITQVTLSEGSVAIINIAVNPISTEDTIVNLNLVSSSSSSVRFNPIPSQVTILAGTTSKSVVLNTIDDSLVQDQEIWNFNISSSDSQVQADPGTLSITLNDNDGGIIPNVPAGPPAPKLLKEINAYPAAIQRITFNNKVYYTGTDAAHGNELWVTDGTESGTRLLKDIEPGVNSSSIGSFYINSDSTLLFFRASTASEGQEVWRTDGTESGTFMIADLEPGASGTNPTFVGTYSGKLYFYATTSLDGIEPYATDGTFSGTHKLRSGAADLTHFLLSSMISYNGELYMAIQNYSTFGFEIWKTNGTTAGTSTVVTATNTGGLFSGGFYFTGVYNSKILFQSYVVGIGYEVFETQGTNATTKLLLDINTGASSSYAAATSYVLGGKLIIIYQDDSTAQSGFGYYATTDATTAGTAKINQPTSIAPFGMIAGKLIYSGCAATECELYYTQGVANDATMIKDINPGTSASSYPTFIAQIGNVIYFTASDVTNGTELWATDGTGAGTFLLKDFTTGVKGSTFTNYTVVGSRLYFTFRSSTYGDEIWTSDGTPSGTQVYKDLVPGPNGSGATNLLAVGGTHLFFTAYNAVSQFASIFISNLSTNSTLGIGHAMVDTLGTQTKNIVEHNGLVYFDAMEGSAGNPLWVTNGTSSGTTRLIDLYPNIICSDIASMVSFGSSLFFLASQESTGTELHISNGTTAGTQLFQDIGAGVVSGGISNITKTDFGKMFFSGSSTSSGSELWVTSGTLGDAAIVKDIYTGSVGSYPSTIKQIPGFNKVIFSATSTTGHGFYISDGTLAGTTLIAGPTNVSTPIFTIPATGGMYLQYLDTSNSRSKIYYYNATTGIATHVNTNYATNILLGAVSYNPTLNLLFYTASTSPFTTVELWKSDGTTAGTSLVKSIANSGNNFNTITLGHFGGKFLFERWNNTSSYLRELWISDGTPAGTINIDTITIASASNVANYGAGIVYNGYYYFTKPDNSYGVELWRTDGTLANTTMVKDINPGIAPSTATSFTVYNGKLYFVATTLTEGIELWRTDGTLLGTEIVQDINPGKLSSSPARLSVLAGKLYFTANKVLSGTEVWVYSE